LSQYSTGGLDTVSKTSASDIVLLLELSTTMKDSVGDLVTATNNYIDKIAATAQKNNVDSRFSVIIFSGYANKTSNVDNSTKTIVSFDDGVALDAAKVSAAKNIVSQISVCPLKAGNTTGGYCTGAYQAPGPNGQPGEGMQAAYNALAAQPSENGKSVLFFADGKLGMGTTIDGWWEWGNCATGKSYAAAAGIGADGKTPVLSSARACGDTPTMDPYVEANRTIKYSQMIKDMNGKVYTVGLFGDEAESISSTSGWDSNQWTPQFGAAGDTATTYVKKGSGFCFLGLFCVGSSDQFITLYSSHAYYGGPWATRRFLEMTSSNTDFDSASSNTMMLSTSGWTTSDEGYQKVVSSAADLSDAFSSISTETIGGTDVGATEAAIVQDVASKYFDVPSDTTEIKVYEQSAKSVSGTSVTWNDDIKDISSTVTIKTTTVNGNSAVTVTGWDYAANYVGEHLNSSFLGKRLIVRFIEMAKDSTSGDVPTNDVDNSQFTGDDGKSWGNYPDPGTVTIVSLYDDSWIPDCDTSKNLKNGICLGKSAKAAVNASGAQRNADIAMSAYSTGSTASDGTTTETTPVDIYYVLDYSNIPDQLNTNQSAGTKYRAQWKEENAAIQRVLSTAISNVQAGTVTSRFDITTYAGSTKGGTAGAAKNVLSIDNSTSESALTAAKTAFAGTSCTTSGCTGSAAPTGTAAQLGTAMDSVWSRMSTSSSTNPKLVVVMSPPTGLGNYSWTSGKAGCSEDGSCLDAADPLYQADKAIAAAQKMKESGATVLTYSGIAHSGAEGAGWTKLTRDNIINPNSSETITNLTKPATLQARQMQELVSSNTWGVTQMGVDSGIKVVDDLADVPTSGTSKVTFLSGSESDTPGTTESDDGQGQGYFYASVLSDSAASAYFEKSVGELVRTEEIEKVKDKPDVTDGVTIADYASAYFEVPSAVTGVRVYEQSASSLDADSNPDFAGIPTQIAGDDDGDDTTPLKVDSNVKVTAVTDSATGTTGYTVSGWDFKSNYVGKHTDAKFFGKRLVIKFTESATKQFLGGANVPTNETGSKHDISGAFATTGFNGNAASSSDTLNSFPATAVNVDLAEIKVTGKNGKGYYGGALNLQQMISLSGADGTALNLAPLKDGSRNNDFVQVEVSFDDGDEATKARMIYSSSSSAAASDYVASENPKWVSGNNLSGESAIYMGAKDLNYTTSVHLKPVMPFALESGSTAMSKDKLSSGKIVDALMDTASTKIYSLLPWIQWNDTQLELGDVNDFTKNLTMNSSSPWRWTGGFYGTFSNADRIPDTDAAGEANVFTEDVTATPQFTFVTGHGDKPSKDPGDNATNKVTDFAPSKNSDFTVTVKLVGVKSKNFVTAYTANSRKNSSDPITAAQSPSNKALSVSGSIENGYPAKTGYDFRVWVVDNYVDPGFPTTCVTDGNMCVGKQISDVTTAADGKRTATVTLTAYLNGTSTGAADTTVNDKTKLADFASAYFGTDADSRNVKVWEQSASKLGSTVEFHRNPVLLSDPAKAMVSMQTQVVYNGADNAPGIQVQATPSATGNPGFNVQGWNYVTNYVGAHASSSNLGKRLVVQFTESVDDCFIGGSNVPSNEESTPGIYTTAAASGTTFPGPNYKQIAQFEDPTVKVPASAACATFADGKAYDLGSLDNGANGLSSLIRSFDGTKAFTFGKIGETDLQYNQFATTTFILLNKDTGAKIAKYVIPGAQTGGDPTFTWLDDSVKVQGTKDVTYSILESVTFDDTGDTFDVTPTSGNEATVYALVPTLSASDSVTSAGEETSLTQSITGFDWRWIGATSAGDKKNDVSLVVSEKPGVKKLVYGLVRGTTPSAGTTGGTVNATVAPTENSDFKAGVILTTAASADGTTVYPADIDRGLVTRSNGDVADGDKISSFSNGHDTEFDDYDFRIWVTGQKVSSLPLTGGLGTGRIFLMVCAGMALIAGAAAAIRKFALSRNRD
jgi:hypothetical protein